MKKFLAILAVVAMVCLSSMAFAADVTIGGSYEVRSRDFQNLNFDSNVQYVKNNPAIGGPAKVQDTQDRIRLDVNVKASDDVKGKIEIERDFGSGNSGSGTDFPDTDWGNAGYESYAGNGRPASATRIGSPASNIGFRESWINFNLPGIPVNVTAGHQLLMLGNGWFFRSRHYGSDAWVVANTTGANTVSFVNVKANEGLVNMNDDTDAYVLSDTYKLNEDMTVAANLTMANDRRGILGLISPCCSDRSDGQCNQGSEHRP